MQCYTAPAGLPSSHYASWSHKLSKKVTLIGKAMYNKQKEMGIISLDLHLRLPHGPSFMLMYPILLLLGIGRAWQEYSECSAALQPLT